MKQQWLTGFATCAGRSWVANDAFVCLPKAGEGIRRTQAGFVVSLLFYPSGFLQKITSSWTPVSATSAQVGQEHPRNVRSAASNKTRTCMHAHNDSHKQTLATDRRNLQVDRGWGGSKTTYFLRIPTFGFEPNPPLAEISALQNWLMEWYPLSYQESWTVQSRRNSDGEKN